MTRQIGISQVRGVVGNIPGKGGSQGSPLPGERAHAVSAQLKSLPVAGTHSVRGELVRGAPENQTMTGFIPG